MCARTSRACFAKFRISVRWTCCFVCLPVPDLTIRTAVLKALNKMRESRPIRTYKCPALIAQVHEEAKEVLRIPLGTGSAAGKAAALTGDGFTDTRTLKDRLTTTLERLFRLLGLRYPPRQIYAAYLAVNRRR
jgi:ATP:ADP antiporter, AAA family